LSTVILRTVKHRLAELMSKPGGLSVETALANANAALDAKSKEAIAIIATKVSGLEGLPEEPVMSQEIREQAYGLASDIVDIAGCLRTPDLFGAAYSLCEILDYFRTGPFSRSAFEVHVRTLRLILLTGGGKPVEDVVAGLKAVKDRVLSGRLDE
jgi:hypothetical protein